MSDVAHIHLELVCGEIGGLFLGPVGEMFSMGDSFLVVVACCSRFCISFLKSASCDCRLRHVLFG